ncbi:PREDICTED: uncharacterized protein LOC108663589 [Theobroma cacao]|uniref:Uncharacterized protein LOC108663589 n=1 Tax=Theobroma cacao TaxID=3641 RepID=A0AB32X2A5_THECC|nr:PREDICTED: uncharacterized protein LOC108663589 [Theobroma cacao]
MASSSFGANKPKPLTIFYEENRSPMNDTSPTMIRGGITIEVPSLFPYKNDKAVPWNYECNILGTASSAPQASFEDLTGVGGITRSGRCYSPEITERVEKGKPAQGEGRLKKADTFSKDQVVKSVVTPNNEVKNPVTEKEAGEFLKFIKHSEYSVVEQLTKTPARISLFSLLLNSEAHRNALLKVLNQAYVAQDISVKKLDHIMGNITVGNFIAFNDEEIPSGGRGSNKALHITIKCKDHAIPRVLVDNGSALNVMPRSTLTKLLVDVSYMRTSHMIVRAFDGTTREVVGDIELSIKISPCIFEVQFQVMDIAPSYNCLLGRPWIHMAGAIPSSLHQKVKFIAEGQLISVCAEEDILAIQPSSAPYVEATEEVPECSFKSFEFVNATYVGEKKVIPTPRLLVATKMGVKQIVGKGCRAGFIHLEAPTKVNQVLRIFDELSIHMIRDEEPNEKIPVVYPVLLGEELSNWTATELPIIFKSSEMSLNNEHEDNLDNDLNIDFEMIPNIDELKNEEEVDDYSLPPDLSRMLEQEENEILPHQELTEMINLRNREEKKEDMPNLNTDIVVHKLPMGPDCKPIKQKLRRMKPEMLLKIKEEVKKQFDAGFLEVAKYPEWVANIVSVPKNDGKV